ncbi:hypothetical protein BDW71DRAFT_185235 [Aspergillus fruticulosus]
MRLRTTSKGPEMVQRVRVSHIFGRSCRSAILILSRFGSSRLWSVLQNSWNVEETSTVISRIPEDLITGAFFLCCMTMYHCAVFMEHYAELYAKQCSTPPASVRLPYAIKMKGIYVIQYRS